MPGDFSDLLLTSAAAAWLTKTLVDLLRLWVVSIDGKAVLATALVIGLVTNVLWTLYQQEPFAGSSDYARVTIQGILAFLGAVSTTKAQKAVASK